MKRTLILFVAALLTACGGGSDSPAPAAQAPAPQPAPIKLFIFAGQSNMNGSDAIISPTRTQDLVDIGKQTDVDRSALFTMATPTTSYAWGDIRGHDGFSLGEAVVDGKKVKVHGPEVGFNRTLGGNIAIIKYADNYPALESGRSAWVKPGTRWQGWQAFVDKQMASLGRPYTVAAVVWFQGIDDGILQRDKASYKADLLQIAADARAKFGNVPFILGRSVNSPIAGGDMMQPIREAQVEVGQMPGNGLIDVDDLGPYVAYHHMTSAAQLVVGERFAKEYIRLR